MSDTIEFQERHILCEDCGYNIIIQVCNEANVHASTITTTILSGSPHECPECHSLITEHYLIHEYRINFGIGYANERKSQQGR